MSESGYLFRGPRNTPGSLTYARHESTVNAGPHRIHTGPGHPSRMVLPILQAGHAGG